MNELADEAESACWPLLHMAAILGSSTPVIQRLLKDDPAAMQRKAGEMGEVPLVSACPIL